MLKSGSVEELKGVVTGGRGFARTNLYYVYLPTLTPKQGTYDFGVLCSSVTLPARQLSSIERVLGPTQQSVVHGFVNPNVTMSFRILNNQKTRDYFEGWQALAMQQYDDIEGRFEVNYPDRYAKNVQIHQLEKGVSYPVLDRSVDFGPVNLNFDIDLGTPLEKTYTWTLDRAYPVSVTYETLSDQSQNEISQVTVEFAYHYWYGESRDPKNKIQKAITGVLGTIGANI